MNENTQLFDSAKPISITLVSGGEDKKVNVRFPSDEEWISRARQRKLITRDIGNGKSTSAVPGAEDADAALFLKIVNETDSTSTLDSFEAAAVIDQLEQADVDDVSRDGAKLLVVLRVPGARVTHRVRMPTIKEVSQYAKNIATYVNARFGKTEMTVNPQVAADFFDKLDPEPEGYAGPVPIIHKVVVAGAVVQEARSLNDAGGEDRNFQ